MYQNTQIAVAETVSKRRQAVDGIADDGLGLVLKRRSMLTSNLRVDNGITAIHHAKGCWFTCLDGRKILDMASGTLCLPFGYGYVPLLQEIVNQYSQVSYNSSRFPSQIYLEAAEAILGVAPPNMAAINHKLTNGSDAVEATLKVARKWSGYDTVVTVYESHHGETGETISASGKQFSNKRAMGGSHNFRYVPPHYCKRCPWGSSPEKCHLDCAKCIGEVLRYEDGCIAAVLLEPVVVNRGVRVSSRTGDYLAAVRDICTNYRLPLIFDEVQSFPWIPEYFFANHFGVFPDMMAVAKGISGGMPLAAVLTEAKYADILDYNEAEHTWGGHPLSCGTSVRTIEIVRNEDFNIDGKGQFLEKRLHELRSIHRVIWDVRRIGLIMALEFANEYGELSEKICERVYQRSLELGVTFRRNGAYLIIKPPIVVTQDEMEFAAETLDRALRTVSSD